MTEEADATRDPRPPRDRSFRGNVRYVAATWGALFRGLWLWVWSPDRLRGEAEGEARRDG